MKKDNADVKLPLIDLESDNTETGGKQESTDSGQPERLSKEDNMYIVYWIRTSNHKDIFTEGYVGITLNFKERLRSHKKSKNKYPINNAIKKHGFNNLIKEVVEKDLSLDEALKLERKFRPEQNIGWNCQQGGNLGIEKTWYNIPKNKLKHSKNTSIKTKEGIAKKDNRKARSERAKLSRKLNKDSYININKGSKNPKAKLTEEQVREIKFNLLPSGMKQVDIAKLFNVKPYVIGFIKSGKTWKHIICDSPDHK